MAADFYIKRGDRLPYFDCYLKNPDETPVDLTNCNVHFNMKIEGSETLKISLQDCTVLDALAGLVRYAWGTTDTETAGNYEAEFEVTFQSGLKETFPNNTWLKVQVVGDLA